MPAGDALIRNTVRAIQSHAPKQQSTMRMVDLGSGDGVVLLGCAKELTGDWTYVGVENNLWLVLASQWRAARLNVAQKVSFRVQDLYRQDLSQFDVIFVCLVPSMLAQVEQRVASTAKEGSIVISARFPLPSLIPIAQYPGDAVSGVWVYRVVQAKS
jgi:ribosomal protein L11 methylase PrmA